MNKKELEEQAAFFAEFVSDHKKRLFQELLEHRTRFFTIVLEDIYQSQNASAVLRSCDGFGMQDVYIIENRNRFGVDKGVTIGAEKWLTVYRYNDQNSDNTSGAYRALKDKGYQIVVLSPHDTSVPLSEFRPEVPSALVFGAEKAGLSRYALDHADKCIHIPMFGFSESLNLSVCAAICMYHIRHHMMFTGLNWQMTGEEKKDLYLQWLKKSVKNLRELERRFNEMRSNNC
jgi:tRNA (guanosine-2'-O-)-methyltransferase